MRARRRPMFVTVGTRGDIQPMVPIALEMQAAGWSPLFVAAWSGHAEVVAELLQHGADRSIATAQEHLEIPAGSTALSVAQLKGHQDVVDLLR